MTKRTDTQSNCMHDYFGRLAEALNEAGIDRKVVWEMLIQRGVSIDWSKDSIKDELWRPIQQAMGFDESTKDLEREQVSEVYETLNRFVAERFGVSVPWPDRWNR